jgi:hypothetical protein
MVRILLMSADENLVAGAIEKHGARNVFLAMDATVENRHLARRLGLGRYALVGANVDQSTYELFEKATTEKKKAKSSWSKKAEEETLAEDIEAVVDESNEEVQ